MHLSGHRLVNPLFACQSRIRAKEENLNARIHRRPVTGVAFCGPVFPTGDPPFTSTGSGFRKSATRSFLPRPFFYKLILAVLSGGLLAALLYFNLKIAAVAPAGFRFSRVDNAIELPAPDLIDPLFRRLLLPAALLLGLLAASQGAVNWERLPLFLNATPFNLQDPLFGSDIGFYVFRLPMYSAAYQWLIFALTLTLLATAAVYFLYRGIQYGPQGLYISEKAKTHLLILIALILLLKAVGYLLDSYELVYSSRGAAFGASYTDVYAILPALRILTVLALVAAALCVLQISRPGFRYLIGGVAVLVLVHAVGLNLYPAMIQRFHVVPNEVDAERPFHRTQHQVYAPRLWAR